MIDGATITLGSGQSTTTNAAGQYSFTVDYGWNNTITATKTGYTIVATAPMMVVPVTSNQVQNFNGTLHTYVIKGTVTGLVSGATYPVSILAIGTSGSADFSADATSGSYMLSLPYGWTGSLSATSPAYALSPVPAVTFGSPVTADQNQDYEAVLNRYTVSGVVNGEAGGLDGVNITVAGDYSTVITTSNGGKYSFSVNYNDAVTITPSLTGFAFDPSMRDTGHVTEDLDGQDFMAKSMAVTISGHIVSEIVDVDLSGITLTVSGSSSGIEPVVTDKEGFYIFKNVPYDFTGTVTPTKAGYDFASTVIGSTGLPAITYTSIHENQKDQNYIMMKASHRLLITGRVIDATLQRPVVGLVLEATGFVNGVAFNMNATTDEKGTYTLQNVPFTWSGTVQPRRSMNYKFQPSSRRYPPLEASQYDQNYKALSFGISG